MTHGRPFDCPLSLSFALSLSPPLLQSPCCHCRRKTWQDRVTTDDVKTAQYQMIAEACKYVWEGKKRPISEQETVCDSKYIEITNSLWGDGDYGARMSKSPSWRVLHKAVQDMKLKGMPIGRLFSGTGGKKKDFSALTKPEFCTRRVWTSQIRRICNNIIVRWPVAFSFSCALLTVVSRACSSLFRRMLIVVYAVIIVVHAHAHRCGRALTQSVGRSVGRPQQLWSLA